MLSIKLFVKVLRATNFDFGRPHSIQFLRRYRFYISPDKQVYNMAKYIIEAAMVTYELAHHLPSTVAAAAIYLACFMFGVQLTTKRLFTEVFKIDHESLVKVASSFVEPVSFYTIKYFLSHS